MRRQSFSSSLSSASSGGGGEPLIVVEESTLAEEELERRRTESPPRCVDPDSPSLNPYLLSPWREARKHSLPTPQCTSGITASQVSFISPTSCCIALVNYSLRGFSIPSHAFLVLSDSPLLHMPLNHKSTDLSFAIDIFQSFLTSFVNVHDQKYEKKRQKNFFTF